MKTDNVQTLNGLFLNTCRRYVKPCLLSEKVEGTFAPISTAEFESRVRRLSLGNLRSPNRTGRGPESEVQKQPVELR